MTLEPGDVVQIIPGAYGEKTWMDGCFLAVTEPKKFGCQGYIIALPCSCGSKGGHAFLRPTWDKMEYVGKATYIRDEREDEE